MKDKILTIIIPAYNMELYLERCCKSLIIGENLDKLEILIVNDGSEDMTSKIGHTFENNYPGIFRVIDKENGNYGSCINRGLREASGTYVKVLDADDRFDTKNFESYVRCLIELKDVDLIITNVAIVDENNVEKRRRTYGLKEMKTCDFGKLSVKKINLLTHHSITWKTENLRKLGFRQLEGISYTDQEWVRLPMLTVERFFYYPQVIYLYWIGRIGQTMERETYIKNMWMQIEIKKHMIEFFEEKKSGCPAENQERMERLIYDVLNNIYGEYIMYKRDRCNMQNIQDLDKWLAANHADMYENLANARFNKYLPVKYIRHWRRAMGGGTAFYYNLVYKEYKILSSVKRSFLRSKRER